MTEKTLAVKTPNSILRIFKKTAIALILSFYGPLFADIQHEDIEDYILSETILISRSKTFEDQLMGLLSRGDSYLIKGDYKSALEDYHKVSTQIEFLPIEEQRFYSFWSLFGETIALSNQGEATLAEECLYELKTSAQPCSWNYDSFPMPTPPPIIGPDAVSPEWCEKCAKGLAASMINEYILKLVKDKHIQQQLLDIVRNLYVQAENCCKLSALDPIRYNWKDCLGPLNEKRWLWKQKWERYGIPPDPSD